MNDDKLKEANELQQTLKVAKANLKAWQTATLEEKGVRCGYKDKEHRNCSGVLPVSPETFTVIKALNVEYWGRLVGELDEKYEQL